MVGPHQLGRHFPWLIWVSTPGWREPKSSTGQSQAGVGKERKHHSMPTTRLGTFDSIQCFSKGNTHPYFLQPRTKRVHLAPVFAGTVEIVTGSLHHLQVFTAHCLRMTNSLQSLISWACYWSSNSSSFAKASEVSQTFPRVTHCLCRATWDWHHFLTHFSPLKVPSHLCLPGS